MPPAGGISPRFRRIGKDRRELKYEERVNQNMKGDLIGRNVQVRKLVDAAQRISIEAIASIGGVKQI